ncbi:ATP-binding protein [Sorangium sp. So ce693]|uniref:ATP-binding protein n=1 Tax=Sorangium sp. So ce693 TaxID=3133318 RepID=UPI003F63B527
MTTVADRHNVLLVGAPGSGRTGGPRPIRTILPPTTEHTRSPASAMSSRGPVCEVHLRSDARDRDAGGELRLAHRHPGRVKNAGVDARRDGESSGAT